ncbi:hypothetical protein [Sphingomicrobium astaxanthinifaciens]|uniref:hypothetical protein n=1 Tax=Sphingomicrobium astaxanthinifaciens TaxID=1227949 RepID=UPI001FCC6106|nr:hypothetical protein [Sphingomicrobium astaxanthinifaciens]MCJ7421322.1 hypothetical protein [Sphingomicrobium astaxanthinifaciens]
MIRYVPKDIAKDVTAFVEKSCKETGVHTDETTGRVAIATTSEKDAEKIRKKFADKGFVL